MMANRSSIGDIGHVPRHPTFRTIAEVACGIAPPPGGRSSLSCRQAASFFEDRSEFQDSRRYDFNSMRVIPMMTRMATSPRRWTISAALALAMGIVSMGCDSGKAPILDDDPEAVVALKKAGAGVERIPNMGAQNLIGRAIDMSDTSNSREVLAHLALVDGLVEIKLTGPDVTDETLAALPEIKSATRLDLTGSEVTDAGLKHLKALPSLTLLNLTDTQVTGSGLADLGPNINSLNLTNLPIGDNDLSNLEHLKGLSMLVLGGTQVTAAGVRKLRNGRPFPLTVGINLN